MSTRRFWGITITGLAVATLLMGVAANTLYFQKVKQDAARELMLLAQLRRGALERYLRTAESEIRFWATSEGLLDIYYHALADWQSRKAAGENPGAAARRGYIDNNPYPFGERRNLLDNGDGSEYSVQHLRAQPLMKRLLEERGYYDFFAITPSGDVLYTIEKEDDFGTSLVTGPYRDSGLGEVFQKTRAATAGTVVFTDISQYAPSRNVPAMFMAMALRDNAGGIEGIWALQLPIDRILEVMRPSVGLGDTGETYVVGQDLLMRSDSRFIEESTVLEIVADSSTVHRALRGEEGVAYTSDYRGVEVLSAFTSVQVNGGRWAIMSEIDRRELLGWAAGNRAEWAGLLGLSFVLAIWSAWYLRRGVDREGTDFDVSGSLDLDIESS